MEDRENYTVEGDSLFVYFVNNSSGQLSVRLLGGSHEENYFLLSLMIKAFHLKLSSVSVNFILILNNLYQYIIQFGVTQGVMHKGYLTLK